MNRMGDDVFISYSHRDAEAIRRLRLILEANGITCWMDDRLRVSENFDSRIAEIIPACRLFFVLVSPQAVAAPKQIKREVIVADRCRVPIVAMFTTQPQTTEFHYLLGTTNYLTADDPPQKEQLETLVRSVRQVLARINLEELSENGKSTSKAPPSVTPAPRGPAAASETPAVRRAARSVALLYRRKAEPDSTLVEFLDRELTARGYAVFRDQHLTIGDEWYEAIKAKLKESDAVIPLLSSASIESDMLAWELREARKTRDLRGADDPRPMILPVRVGFEGALGNDLGAYLDKLQYFLWKTPADNERLLTSLIQALGGARTVDPRRLEMPGGVMPVQSALYIERESDAAFHQAVAAEHSIVLVNGARQMGKTSLLARGLHRAREAGVTVAATDFQRLNAADFRDMRRFYYGLADMLAEALDLEEGLDSVWKDTSAPNVNFDRFMKLKVLKPIEGRLVWAIDEVDRLFGASFGTEVFGLFRSWHNAREFNPDAHWRKLTLVIGYATEAALFIKDVNMSPFNVGTRLTLRDFTLSEVAELNARHSSPLSAPGHIEQFHSLIGGQPFLVRRSLYALAVEGLDFGRFCAEAPRDDGLFGDHLRRFYVLLHKDPTLERAVALLLRGENVLTPEQFHRLRSAGLVRGESRHNAELRCGIYATYLRDHLVA